MKPRTKHEKHVVELVAKLPALTPAQQSYSREHCFHHRFVLRCGKYHCTDCGAVWEAEGKEVRLVDSVCGVECPQCGHHLDQEIDNKRKQKWFEISSFQIVTTIGDLQVSRLFYTRKYIKVGEPARYWISEAVQIVMKPGKPDVVLARPMSMNYWYVDSYIFTKEISIKAVSDRWGTYHEAYFYSGHVVYPRRRVIPELKRNGYSRAVYDLPTIDVMQELLRNPKYETVVKAGRIDILKGLSVYEIGELWQQVKMLIRHNYHPSSFGVWKDTIKMAGDCGYDTHSPKYVLPADLNEMHDMMTRRNNRRLARENAKNIRLSNDQYRKHLGELLDVVIVEGDITIRPLQNKEEFIDEGDKMHHCVATYFDKKGCLILGVRSNGQRIATVELSTDDFHVVQCRAVCNKKPERYNEIMGILASRRNDFMKARKSA